MQNKLKKYRLNLTPVLSDFSLLIVGIFLLIVVGTTYQLAQSENPTPFDTEKYFDTGLYSISGEDSMNLVMDIKSKILPDILESLEDNTLISLRIEGHTDRDPVTMKKGRRFTNNDELSFFRAQTFSQILNTIVKEQAPEKSKELLRHTVLSAYGSNKEKFGYKQINDKDWVVFDRDSLPKTVIAFGPADSTSIAKEAFKLNRRVVVNIVKRGI